MGRLKKKRYGLNFHPTSLENSILTYRLDQLTGYEPPACFCFQDCFLYLCNIKCINSPQYSSTVHSTVPSARFCFLGDSRTTTQSDWAYSLVFTGFIFEKKLPSLNNMKDVVPPRLGYNFHNWWIFYKVKKMTLITFRMRKKQNPDLLFWGQHAKCQYFVTISYSLMKKVRVLPI